MKYRVVIEARADRDIDAIVLWKRTNASTTVADHWSNGLFKKIDSLETFPARCPFAAEKDDLNIEIRELLHGSRGNIFRILFTINDDVVSIITVRHAAQDKFDPDAD